jgi:hypothetical protein
MASERTPSSGSWKAIDRTAAPLKSLSPSNTANSASSTANSVNSRSSTGLKVIRRAAKVGGAVGGIRVTAS